MNTETDTRAAVDLLFRFRPWFSFAEAILYKVAHKTANLEELPEHYQQALQPYKWTKDRYIYALAIILFIQYVSDEPGTGKPVPLEPDAIRHLIWQTNEYFGANALEEHKYRQHALELADKIGMYPLNTVAPSPSNNARFLRIDQ